MKIVHVKSARKSVKERKCVSCGHHILPGDQYKHAEPYRGPRLNWCALCTPKRSQLTSSKLADVYAAIEDFEQGLSLIQAPERLYVELSEVQSQVEATLEEYCASLEAMPEHLRDSSPVALSIQDTVDALEAFRDLLGNFEVQANPDEHSLRQYLELIRQEGADVVEEFQA